MLLSYLRIALRALVKQRVYSLINVLGLSVGIAACLVILVYLNDEYSYDDHHEHVDRVYRVVRHFHQPGEPPSLSMAPISPEIAPQLEADFPEIERAVRVFYGGIWLFVVGDRHVETQEFMFAEPDIFEVLTLPFIEGDPATALDEPYTAVLTESFARTLFGRTDVLGEPFLLDNDYEVKVTGVIEDMPTQTHLHGDALVSFKTIEREMPFRFGGEYWGYNSFLTYVMLREGADPDELIAKFPAFVNRHKKMGSDDTGLDVTASDITSLSLQRIDTIHMHSDLDNDVGADGDDAYAMLFAGICAAILIVACVNFMNLATARSAQRAREIGLRKVIGANRRMLIGQFLGESFLITGAAMILAVVQLELSLPYFMNLLGKDPGMSLFDSLGFIPVLLGLWVLVSLVAGFYPAFYLSGYKPTRILRGELTKGTRASTARRALVVVQFAVSVGLIITMGVTLSQVRFIQSKELGFVTKDIYQINSWPDPMKRDWPLIKERLLKDPAVKDATICSFPPGTNLIDFELAFVEVDGEWLPFPETLKPVVVDHNFFSTFEIDLIAGRTFSPDLASDSSYAYVINLSAARIAGWSSPQEALGKELQYGSKAKGTVIGVVEDVHYESLRSEIKPMVFYVNPMQYNQISARAVPGGKDRVLALLEDIYAEYWPDWPFRHTSMERQLTEMYRGESVVSTMFAWCAGFATFIACLGLLGLASFTAEVRSKEIGIRKTLGASTPSIVMLLVKEFALLVLIAILIAWPVSWLLMSHWLDTFAYHIDLNHGLFLAAAVLALALSVVTVATQALRAASIHPVNALRVE